MSLEEIKEQIKQAPISQVIQTFMPLTRKGQNLEGICPFHADTKPSLKVNDQKGMYKCFACGAGGDAITFVKEFKKYTYIEAIKESAKILGLSTEGLEKEKKVNPKIALGLRVLSASTKIYRKFAATNPAIYKEFLVKRELTEKSVENFHIGFAPGNNIVTDYLSQLPDPDGSQAQKIAEEIGLIRPSKNGYGHYDFYRERVMFPIHDHTGQVRGYSSRAVLPHQEPKYLNSGDSFLFKKGSILFGYFLAKSSIRLNNKAIIVEGNMDTIMMHQHGFDYTVGTMGTALSDSCIRLLINQAQDVFLGMDSDPAGMKAMERVNKDFMSLGVLPKYLDFAPHKDPDDFLKAEGHLSLMERMEKAPHFIDQLIKNAIPASIPENLEVKLKIMKQIFEYLSPLKEHLSATERIIGAAKTLGLRSDAESILLEYKKSLKVAPAPQMQKAATEAPTPTLEESEELALSASVPILKEKDVAQAPLTSGEKQLLKTLITHPECLTAPQMDEILDYVVHTEVKDLVQWLVQIYLEIDELEYVNYLKEQIFNGGYCKEIETLGSEALFQHSQQKLNEKVIERLLKDLRIKMHTEKLRSKRKEYSDKQKTSQTQEEVEFCLSEIMKIDKTLQHIRG